MIDKKTFKKVIAEPFERSSFIKKGQTWYLDGNKVIVVTNLQKCDWNETYFINIGFWLKALGEAIFPPVHKCHLSYRVESLFPNQQELILTSCNLEMSDPEKLADLSHFLSVQLIPFLKDCLFEENLKEFMAKGILEHGLIFLEARTYLT